MINVKRYNTRKSSDLNMKKIKKTESTGTQVLHRRNVVELLNRIVHTTRLQSVTRTCTRDLYACLSNKQLLLFCWNQI